MKFKFLASQEQNSSKTERAFVLAIANTVNLVLNVLLLMAATRYLSKIEVSVASQTFLVYTSAYIFLTLGIQSGIYYYLSNNEYRKRTVAKECILCCIATSFVFSAFIIMGGDNILVNLFGNAELINSIYWLIPYSFFMTISTILSCFFVYENRIKFSAVYSLIQSIVILLISIIAVLIFSTGTSLVIARVMVTCAFSILTIVFIFSILPYDNSRLSFVGIKSLIKACIPLGIASVFGTLSHDLDKWIIGIMLSTSEYAVYVQGARELPFITPITASILAVMITDLTNAANSKEYEKAVNIFRTIASKSAFFLMPIMIFSFFCARIIITILYTKEYIDASSIFQIYLLYLPIRIVYYDPLLIALGKSKFVMYKMILTLILNALLSYAFVLFFGAKGAAIATILSVYLFSVPLNLYVISKTTNVKWTKLLPFKTVIQYILYSVPGGLACYLFENVFSQRLNVYYLLAFEAVLFFSCTGAVFVKLGLIDIRSAFQYFVKKIKKDKV